MSEEVPALKKLKRDYKKVRKVAQSWVRVNAMRSELLPGLVRLYIRLVVQTVHTSHVSTQLHLSALCEEYWSSVQSNWKQPNKTIHLNKLFYVCMQSKRKVATLLKKKLL